MVVLCYAQRASLRHPQHDCLELLLHKDSVLLPCAWPVARNSACREGRPRAQGPSTRSACCSSLTGASAITARVRWTTRSRRPRMRAGLPACSLWATTRMQVCSSLASNKRRLSGSLGKVIVPSVCAVLGTWQSAHSGTLKQPGSSTMRTPSCISHACVCKSCTSHSMHQLPQAASTC